MRGERVSNICLPQELLQRAQHDFVQRRKGNRCQLQDYQTSGPKIIETTENDFHRWLTLTRLQRRSRLVTTESVSGQVAHVAGIEDWEASLSLDDSMKRSFSSNQE